MTKAKLREVKPRRIPTNPEELTHFMEEQLQRASNNFKPIAFKKLLGKIIQKAGSGFQLHQQPWFKEVIALALHQACENSNYKLLAYLLVPPVNCPLEDIEKLLLSDGEGIQYINIEPLADYTLLSFATSLSWPGLLKKILTARSINIFEPDRTGDTPLQRAVIENSSDCLQLLIDENPKLFTGPVEKNTLLLSLLKLAIQEDSPNVFTVLLNKIKDITPGIVWMKLPWFKQAVTDALYKSDHVLNCFLQPPVSCSIADLESLMPAAEQKAIIKSTRKTLLKKPSFIAMASHCDIDTLETALQSLPAYSLYFFLPLSTGKNIFDEELGRSFFTGTSYFDERIDLAQKDIAKWEQQLLTSDDPTKHQLHFQISMACHWLSAAYITLAFYKRIATDETELNYVKANEYFLKAENVFKMIPEGISNSRKHEIQAIIETYKKLNHKILHEEITDPLLERCITGIRQKRALTQLSLEKLSMLSNNHLQREILKFSSPIALPKDKKHETKLSSAIIKKDALLAQQTIRETKQTSRKYTPAYILRMAQACAKQLTLGFNAEEIQSILGKALWQQQGAHELTAPNYAALQNHLLDAIDLWKNAMQEQRLSRKEKLAQLSSCLTQVVKHYLTMQRDMHTLVTKAQAPVPIIFLADRLPDAKELMRFARSFIFVTGKDRSSPSECYYIDETGHEKSLCTTDAARSQLKQLLAQSLVLAEDSKITKPTPLQPLTSSKELQEFLRFAASSMPPIKSSDAPITSTYDKRLGQTLFELLMWCLRYTPAQDFQGKYSQLTAHLQHKLAQCRWVTVAGKFFSPEKTTGLQLVYYEWADSTKTKLRAQPLFPGDNKALEQFVLADLPLEIHPKAQFKTFLTAALEKPEIKDSAPSGERVAQKPNL